MYRKVKVEEDKYEMLMFLPADKVSHQNTRTGHTI